MGDDQRERVAIGARASAMSRESKATERDDSKKAHKAKVRAMQDRDGGTHIPLPHVVLDSPGFLRATHTQIGLLFAIAAPIFKTGGAGLPNGGLMTTRLAERGWKSRDVISRNVAALIECGLLCETRKGGKNRPSLYAVTWLALGTNGTYNLDINPARWDTGHRGAYLRPEAPPRAAGSSRTEKATASRRKTVALVGGTSPGPSDVEHQRRVNRQTVSTCPTLDRQTV